jgi:disease resistance protein RPM1
LYDLGERYFNELVNRSMMQPIYDKDGSPSACRVHDMILDLIISLSAQENFVTILEGPACHISTACKIRRLSLRGSKSDSKEEQMIFPETVNISHVRSVVAFGDAVQWMPPMSRFPVLRVLAFKSKSRNNIRPKDLGSLQHLRYLELGGVLETELLEGIENLKLLKTLHLWGPLKGELPACISQLRQLENLITGDYGMKLRDGIGNLISLHELSWLCVNESPNTLAELGNLTKLRVLKIDGLHDSQSYVKTILRGLSNLVNLRTLNLEGDGTCSLDCTPEQWTGPAHLQNFDGYHLTLSQVPRWFSFLSELSSLSMWVNLLRQEDLELLGALPMLRFLQLKVDPRGTITEEQLVVGADHRFRSLAEFEFKHYTRCWLKFARGAMPKLQMLELYFEVRKMEGVGFDIGLENLASLKHVTVTFNCEDASMKEVMDVEDEVFEAIYEHPNRLTHLMLKDFEELMIEDEDEDGHEESEER